MSTQPVFVTLQWQLFPFLALSGAQMYEVMQLRSDVFVVEQNCAFPDMDGRDAQSMHLLGTQIMDGTPLLVAYARCLPQGLSFAEVSVGRVVTRPNARGQGLGHLLIQQAIAACATTWGAQPIRIGAQERLKDFYQQHGFVDMGLPYSEDGIAHLEMLRQP
jgi:ElaA protein